MFILPSHPPSCRFCLAYCYYHILEDELHSFQTDWNTHRIRKSHGARCPGGVPDDLYLLPQLNGMHVIVNLIRYNFPTDINDTGSNDCKCTDIDGEVWLIAYASYAEVPQGLYPAEFKSQADVVLQSTFAIEQSQITIDNADMIYRHLVSVL